MIDNSIQGFPDVLFDLAPELRDKVELAFVFDPAFGRRGWRMTDVATGWRHLAFAPLERTGSRVFARHLVDWYRSHSDDVHAGASTGAEPTNEEQSHDGRLGLIFNFHVGEKRIRFSMGHKDDYMAAATRRAERAGIELPAGSWEPHASGFRNVFVWQPEAQAA